MPFTSTKQAGVEMRTICAGGQLGKALAAAVVTDSSSLHIEVRSGNASGMMEEWCPELGRGDDVVKEIGSLQLHWMPWIIYKLR